MHASLVLRLGLELPLAALRVVRQRLAGESVVAHPHLRASQHASTIAAPALPSGPSGDAKMLPFLVMPACARELIHAPIHGRAFCAYCCHELRDAVCTCSIDSSRSAFFCCLAFLASRSRCARQHGQRRGGTTSFCALVLTLLVSGTELSSEASRLRLTAGSSHSAAFAGARSDATCATSSRAP